MPRRVGDLGPRWPRVRVAARLRHRPARGFGSSGAPLRGTQSSAAQLVEDRALDAELGVRLELAVLPGIVLVDRVHQPDHARVVQVVQVDVRGEAYRDPVHDVSDQRSVLEHDLVFERGGDVSVVGACLAQPGLHTCPPERLTPRRSRECNRNAGVLLILESTEARTGASAGARPRQSAHSVLTKIQHVGVGGVRNPTSRVVRRGRPPPAAEDPSSGSSRPGSCASDPGVERPGSCSSPWSLAPAGSGRIPGDR